MNPTITLAQAQAAATDQIREAATGAFPPGFSLEELPPQPLNCTDSADKPTGQVLLGVTFWINGLPTTQNNNTYFDALKTWWAGHGWTLSTDSRPADMFINATRDGYLMSLRANINQRLATGNSTPCVGRNGASPTATMAQMMAAFPTSFTAEPADRRRRRCADRQRQTAERCRTRERGPCGPQRSRSAS
ncbi:hypothetical protein [Amycolatopsis sp. Hca4]|uniref:hypothetical protein n=1 Tax=Amycolatopsis sp. Hca4 TaxID=2742131 RepID=UPI0020CAEF0E|nr:hypothetical protein [Amycolatopsis sp. Hca4]